MSWDRVHSHIPLCAPRLASGGTSLHSRLVVRAGGLVGLIMFSSRPGAMRSPEALGASEVARAVTSETLPQQGWGCAVWQPTTLHLTEPQICASGTSAAGDSSQLHCQIGGCRFGTGSVFSTSQRPLPAAGGALARPLKCTCTRGHALVS